MDVFSTTNVEMFSHYSNTVAPGPWQTCKGQAARDTEYFKDTKKYFVTNLFLFSAMQNANEKRLKSEKIHFLSMIRKLIAQ